MRIWIEELFIKLLLTQSTNTKNFATFESWEKRMALDMLVL